jgi:outer membrane protein assembly factor BamB
VPAQENATVDWLQWGGPHRDFTSDATGLAESWPGSGPKELWRRDLGEGDTAIVIDGERLFTMYRRGGREVVVALSTADGRTLWEYDYGVRLSGYDLGNGSGPHASPLVVGDRVFTVGFVGDFHGLDKRTGRVLWSVNLWDDLGGTVRPRGYSSSPIEYDGTIIVPVGGRGQAVVAFDPADGSVIWRGGDLDNAQASPMIIDVDGQDQLIAFMVDFVAGFDPSTGQLLWRHPHRTNYGLNIATPVWGDDNVLFVSSAYGAGSRALRLSVQNGATRVEEQWFTNRMRLHFGNAIRIGDTMFGANGDFGPSFVTAVNMADGNVLWRDRSFAKASFLRADGKLIVLDEDGVLGLARVTPTGMQVLSRADVFRSRSWTVPTLAGTVLYARDLQEIAAFDVSAAANPGH